MSTIYVVQGECGEYDDHREWAVKAYTDQQEAVGHALRANLKAKEWDYPGGLLTSLAAGESYQTYMGELDPIGYIDYTGTHYSVYPLELT